MGVNKEQKHLPVPKLALSAKNKSRNGCKSIPTTNCEGKNDAGVHCKRSDKTGASIKD